MSDYKNTLNLPTTEFPMKANLTEREPAMLKHWDNENIYSELRKQRKGKPKFILHDGPPYANGDIHMGHAVNKVLKDIVVKFKTLSGFDSPYVPGWDCHGLPIEIVVEKKEGKPGQKLSVDDFRAACNVYAKEHVEKQRNSFKRLGVLGDWENPYLTMDHRYEANTIRCLADMVKKGYLQRGFKPVHWCVSCGSALAEAEVEYQDKTSPAIDVSFKVCDINRFQNCFDQYKEKLSNDVVVPIWTTTPWTLPANQAVALNPLLNYVLVRYHVGEAEKYLLIVENLVDPVMKRYDIENYQVMAQAPGKVFEGMVLQHPFYDRQVPIVLGEHVTVETGTGAVHTAPGHGQEDYLVGMKYRLPIHNPVDANGCFLPDTPLFAGEFVTKANDHVVAVLKEKNNLLHQETVMHSYPCCWRHKTPLIFRATPQWFVNLDQKHLRENALRAINQVNWIPAWGQATLSDLVMKRPDWCISRQRTCGVPITVFIHKEKQTLHPKMFELMQTIADRVEKQGLKVWHHLEMNELLGDEAAQYDKVTDVLDVWFEAGVSHTCVLKQDSALAFPADLYLEGSDQYRGWFQSSLLTSAAMYETAPYRQVLLHGFTVDAEGRKMSKSLGNVIAPETVMKTLGADILRLWVASIDYHNEIVVSDEILKRTSDVYRRIRNTARFLLANLHGFDPEKHKIPPEKMLALDCWAVDKTRLLQIEIQKAYENYQFHLVFQKIHYFCSIEMGSFYLDIIKDRQYTTKTDSIPRRSAQTAMYYIIESLVRWIAPILSFTADEIWKFLPGKRESSVFLTTWYSGLFALSEKEIMNQAYWEEVLKIRDLVNKEIEPLRNQGILGSSLEAEVVLYVDKNIQKMLQLLEDELRFVLITSSAKLEDFEKAPADATLTVFPGLKLKVTASPHPKCGRCWHRRADVGTHTKHPELCLRCVENVEGQGEKRRYA